MGESSTLNSYTGHKEPVRTTVEGAKGGNKAQGASVQRAGVYLAERPA